jgi:DNA-3-methyladenine glycosylase I
MIEAQTIAGTDGRPRCRWCAAAPEFESYHDKEWGYPVGDDLRLFEKISLEAFQSGLSWRTILAKRENFRRAFDAFDFHKVARYGAKDVTRLLNDEGIVRHRGKIEAVVNNARCAVDLQATEGSLAAYIWRYEADRSTAREPRSASTSPESIALSKDLKKRGWKFVGPTTAYAFMQAMGLVNDHAVGCVMARKAEEARDGFRAPGTGPGTRAPSPA